MYYPQEVVDQVLAANDIVDVIGGYVKLKRSGANHMGLCPFHGEKTPSFSVSGSKQLFYCFGCGEGGNALTFLMKYENCSFQEALKMLANRAGIRLPEVSSSEQGQERKQLREQLLAINKEAATYYYRMLRSPRGKSGLNYLSGRKLSLQTMKSFGLGYADGASSDLVAYLRSKGFSDENILTSGVASHNEKSGLHDRFWNRVMFPIMDVSGHVIGFGGRVMGEGEPKYMNSPETPVFDKSRNLYGLYLAKKSRTGSLILCEGYMDVISMHQAGFSQAVASLGTSFTEGQAMILRRYAKQILLAYDSDTAGVKAALRNIEVLKAAGLTGRVVNMEPYKDPDEFIKNLGKEEFQKRLDQAENSFFFEIRQLEKGYTMSDPGSRTAFYHEIAKRLCSFENEIERDSYCKAMSEKYFIEEGMLRREVDRTLAVYQKESLGESTQRFGDTERFRGSLGTAKTRRNQPFIPEGSGQSEGSVAAKERILPNEKKRLTRVQQGQLRNESLLLTWISDDPQLYPQIRTYLSEKDFSEGTMRECAACYIELLEKEWQEAPEDFESRESIQTTPSGVIARFSQKEPPVNVTGIFETRLPELDADKRLKAFRDILCGVKRARIQNLSKNMRDKEALDELCEVKKELSDIQNLSLVLHVLESDYE